VAVQGQAPADQHSIVIVGADTPQERQWGTAMLVLAIGFLVAASLIAIALGFPSGAYLLASKDVSPDSLATICTPADVLLDEGYGVTRSIRRDCPN